MFELPRMHLIRRWVNTTKVLKKELVIRPMRRTPSSANLSHDRASKPRNVGIMDQKYIQLFVSHPSWRSWRAQRLLSRKGYTFEVVDTTEDAEVRGWLAHFAGRSSMPCQFVDHRLVGASGRLWPWSAPVLWSTWCGARCRRPTHFREILLPRTRVNKGNRREPRRGR